MKSTTGKGSCIHLAFRLDVPVAIGSPGGPTAAADPPGNAPCRLGMRLSRTPTSRVLRHSLRSTNVLALRATSVIFIPGPIPQS